MPTEEIPVLPDNPYPLGRHVNHDERSRDFPFSARPESARSIGPKEWTRRSPIFDQGQVGSCTGNAGVGWESTDDAVRQGSATKVEADALALYSDATKIDPYKGTYPPDDTGSDGLSIAKVLKARGVVDVYTHIFKTADVKIALQTTPVLIGIPWYQGMFNPDGHGVVTKSGALAGGHELIVVGWDDGTLGWPAAYKIANSWGTGWGAQGFCFMSEDTLSTLLADQGDGTVLHAVGGAPTGKTVTSVRIEHTSGHAATYHTVGRVVVSMSDGTSVTLP